MLKSINWWINLKSYTKQWYISAWIIGLFKAHTCSHLHKSGKSIPAEKNAKSYELWILTYFKENNQNCYFIVALRYDVQPFCQISWTNVNIWPIADFYFHHCTRDIKDLLSILTLTHNRCHCTGTLLSCLHEGVASRVVQYRSTS